MTSGFRVVSMNVMTQEIEIMSAYLNAMSWAEELNEINGLDLEWLASLSIRKLRGIAQYVNQNIERWFYKANLGKSVGYFVKADLSRIINEYYTEKTVEIIMSYVSKYKVEGEYFFNEYGNIRQYSINDVDFRFEIDVFTSEAVGALSNWLSKDEVIKNITSSFQDVWTVEFTVNGFDTADELFKRLMTKFNTQVVYDDFHVLYTKSGNMTVRFKPDEYERAEKMVQYFKEHPNLAQTPVLFRRENDYYVSTTRTVSQVPNGIIEKRAAAWEMILNGSNS